jgi:hypothetical protein
MTEPRQHEKPADGTKRGGAHEQAPAKGMFRARTARPHKGDVGRAGTNEEIYQGSKERELK